MKPVCLVTGAGGRLGSALCKALSGRYHIIAAYHAAVPTIPSQLRQPVTPGAGDTPVFCVQADLTNREDIRRLVEVALARHDRVDMVVNSAADVHFHGKLVELWHADPYPSSQLHLNCVAPFLLVSAIHQECWKDSPADNVRWNRSVINVSSMSGLYAYPERGQAFYSASKAALNMLTLYLALELAPYSVRANAVCPGQFKDASSTDSVVAAIGDLLAGSETGAIVSDFKTTRQP